MRKPTSAPGIEAAFVEQRAAIQVLLTRATRDEIATRYQVGMRLLLLTRNPEKYGERAVERLAEDLGVGSATLYRYSAVAETWPGQDVQTLLARITPSGDPLSWSHLVVLTRAPSIGARRQLTEMCIAHGWSVRELTLHVQAFMGSAVTRSVEPAEDDGPVDAALTEGIESASRASMQVGVFLEALEERLGEDGGESPLLPRAIATFEDLRAKVDAALDSMQQATRASETRMKIALAAPPEVGRSRR
jgi:hypothetical protein